MRNVFNKRPVVGDSGPVVSLTTYGARTASVHLTIESIAWGELRPSRLILWIDDPDTLAILPVALQRLRARGLEVHLSENFGPHTKYFPFIESESRFTQPLVTADDDVIYPRDWLSGLAAAHETNPTLVIGYRVRQIQLSEHNIAPYDTWPLATSARPSILNFATGVGGVIYPAEMLYALKGRGRTFLEHAPRADDIWLHHTALVSSFSVRQVTERSKTFPILAGKQDVGLKHANVSGGGNDAQIAATYSPEDIQALHNVRLAEAGLNRG